MKRLLPLLASPVLLGLALPAHAQDGSVALGVFVKVETANVPAFEEAMKEHSAWHGRQNDTWAWPVYMALTGEQTEYVVLSPNHTWSEFDNPPVDMTADMMHWAGSGARHAVSEEIAIWRTLTEHSFVPETPAPLVQVLDFHLNSPGSEEAVRHGIAKFAEAIRKAGAPASFAWLEMMSADRPPQFSVAVYANSFAELGQEGPTPIQILTGAFGDTEARQIADAFSAATTPGSSRIWMMRPDLSYAPN